ncbi:MAG TPA: cytochrome c oxidase subunit 4 [Natronosporangium sp.]|nr:cytochrome c oxidase subunit 4 [Natronosporangium sp.]
MRTEWRIFGGIAVFLLGLAGLYAWWTWDWFGEIEWIGSIALLLSATLSLMVALYFLVVARRIEPRPEDRLDGEIAEGAGEVGFFSPGSYFPVGLALAISLGGLGVAFWMWWLIAGGIVAVITACAGMLFEYYTGTRRTASQ